MENPASAAPMDASAVSSRQFIAYRTRRDEGWEIQPGTINREWMDSTFNRVAYRCLPLSIANQAGWVIACPVTFKARWQSRSSSIESLSITFSNEKEAARYKRSIKSNFGLGIVTFAIPYLFRTPPGVMLWAHGPANAPRSDVVALDGVVETDWSPWPFTMNWKILKPKTDIWFRKGEPICMVTPMQLAVMEQLEPKVVDIEDDPQLLENFIKASEARIQSTVTKAPEEGKWELNYTRGYLPDGRKAPAHRSRLNLKGFAGGESA